MVFHENYSVLSEFSLTFPNILFQPSVEPALALTQNQHNTMEMEEDTKEREINFIVKSLINDILDSIFQSNSFEEELQVMNICDRVFKRENTVKEDLSKEFSENAKIDDEIEPFFDITTCDIDKGRFVIKVFFNVKLIKVLSI